MMAVAARGIFTHPIVFQIAPGLHVLRFKRAAFERHSETAASAESDYGVARNSLALLLAE